MSPPDLVLDIALAPNAALARVEGAINRRERRMLGIFKTNNEYVGAADGDGFEIWERQQRAVHAVARLRRQAGGARLEVRYVLPRSTWAIIVVFFALYSVVGVALSALPPDPSVTAVEAATIAGGGGGIAVGFRYFTRRQRADLEAFIARLFADDALRPPP